MLKKSPLIKGHAQKFPLNKGEKGGCLMKIYYNPKLKELAKKLRKNSTLAEILLWNELRSRKMKGYQFMRQKPIGNYIVDFFCSKLKLVIEIDGASHNDKLKKDRIRQERLGALGLKVLRFQDLTVKKDIRSVLRAIKLFIEEQEETTP